ncbi:MAG: sigma-70 family RNA polymerase sigma factor [Clostridiales bacterium]|nr:sigma-70 family RNA polymerase sigma factor [Clostridiales bacterium]
MKLSPLGIMEAAECDRALVSIAHGKPESLDVICKYAERQIFAVAYSVLHDFSLSDDVVQETYVKILEKASGYTPGTSAKAWILTVARNCALDMLRHRSYETPDENIADRPEYRFDESAVVLSMEVKSALDALSDEDRQVVTLKIYAGLRHGEIAKMLGISTEAAKKKYQRALARLKEMME